MEKQFKIKAENIKQLIIPMGACYASDKITVDGEQVSFMYREEAEFREDSGWRFLSGNENQEYANDPNNWAIYECNTIANYDIDIIDYLGSPLGTELERIQGTSEFKIVSNN